MSASENKRVMETIFAGLAKGDPSAFRESIAEDLRWVVMGSTEWSGAYEGKADVMDRLMRPLFAQFADTYTNTAHRFIAEGDSVVVECEGRVTAKSGKLYNNHYCWVCRLEGGKLTEVIEYMDTQHLAAALDAPGAD